MVNRYFTKNEKIVHYSTNLGADMWSYQACTEMVMSFCYDGTNNMFEPAPWDLDANTKECQDTWGPAGTPQPALANS